MHWHFVNKLILLLSLLVISGCSKYNDPIDPYEGYNRVMYKINKSIDKAVIKPIAVTYDTIFPYPVKKGVSNVFDNLFLTSVMANDLLQGEFKWFAADLWRFVINSTIGIAGIFDVAKHAGIPLRQQDFGKTLSKWGDPNSPFFIIPILGPSTIRDATGYIFDYSLFSYIPRIRPISVRNTVYAIQLLDFRTRLLETDEIIETGGIDEYLFVRDSYLQFRKSFINGNNNKDDDDLYVE